MVVGVSVDVVVEGVVSVSVDVVTVNVVVGVEGGGQQHTRIS